MAKVTPRILSGFMELLPEDQLLFNQMFDSIRSVYELFGFAPIETPAIELSEVLLAKGGGETEKQIYRFQRGENDLALHFDLTVPLARYVAQHESELTFPFRRYQMQKVWRAERAQRGRFREFYQCDIDIIGSKDPLTDAEIPSVIYAVFKKLGFEKFTIRINNRKTLNGLFEALGLTDRSVDILRTIDKIDKIGDDAVRKELSVLGVKKDACDTVLEFVKLGGTNAEMIASLRKMDIQSDLFRQGVEELAQVLELISSMGVPERNIRLDLAIARGLDYYTGTVYETILDDYPEIGSVCSGGRFDDLASYYTDTDLPGVGVSIGLTRLFYQLKEAGVVKSQASAPTKVLVAKTSQAMLQPALECATALRDAGIATEVFFEDEKLGKQLKYANRLNLPIVMVVGEQEVETGIFTLRDMASGEQHKVKREDLTTEVQRLLSPHPSR